MVEGWGGKNLIDSYFKERHSIGVRNTKEAADCFDQLYSVMQYGDELDDETEIGINIRKKLSIDLKEQDFEEIVFVNEEIRKPTKTKSDKVNEEDKTEEKVDDAK